jgi:regulator of cell morphogenesis and NO signaling
MSTATATLADLAIKHPGATRVFLKHGLDFCCGGRRPLDEALAEKGLDRDAILAEIEREDAKGGELTGWAERPLPELLDFIEGHYHARHRADLPDVIAMAEKVEQVHADKPTCPHGLTALLRVVHAAVLDHLAKEERILFPMIRAGHGSRAGGPIHVMEAEHEDHGQNLARIRELTADLTAPPEACTTWRALYVRLRRLSDELMEHIHLENNVLFPRALYE